jgi:TonB-dependent starch-binding outer membrane protein SusC
LFLKNIIFKLFLFLLTKQQECMKIKVNFKSLVLLVLFSVLGNFAIAQKTISGLVTDGENNEPLVGASIVVTGTTKGTLSDVDGKYTLTDVPASSTSLTFSFTGYANVTIPIGASNTIDAKLGAGALLNEVVVVGYGSVRKVDATGAVSSINEKDFNKGTNTSIEQLMQGRVAGVQVTQNSGAPGGGINVRIRGTSSVRGGNNPLFVVDGVPLSGDATSAGGDDGGFGSSAPKNPLNFLNTDDIEKIDILKDASATAIYGARGANGVVLITTKKGKGKGALDYSYSLGASSITKKYDLLTRDEFIAATSPAKDLGGNTDWQDVGFRTALAHNHSVSYGMGNEKGSYRFSLGYLDQDGIVVNSAIKRYSARFNANQKFLNDKLEVSVQTAVSSTADFGVPITDNSGFSGDLMGGILKSNPSMPIYKNRKSSTLDCDTCELFQLSGGTEPSPAAMLRYTKDITSTLRALGNISAELKIIDGLSFRTNLGFDRSLSDRKVAYSRLLIQQGVSDRNGRAYFNNSEVDNKLMENFFNYTKQFGGVNFTGLLGYAYQSFGSNGKGLAMANFNTSDVDVMLNNYTSVNLVDNGALQYAVAPTYSFNQVDELQSYFGRVNVSVSDKYILTASLRRDGSTRFGGNFKYGNFPSFAAKWRLIQEDFIPKNIFSDLGLRIGYGITGNQEIPYNLYDGRSRYGGYGISGGDGKINGGGIGNVSFENPNLKWESTKQLNFGLDFGFANNRVSGSLEYYIKNTNDLLLQVTSAQPAPRPFTWTNLDADIENKGIELQLGITPVDGKDFRWNITGNVAYNQNLVKRFGGVINTGEINGQGLTGAFAQRIQEGQPLYAFFLREFGGYDDQGVTLYPTGDFQQFLGKSPLPTVTAGLTNSFTYKNFEGSFFFNGVFGNYIYSNTANAFFTKGSLSNGRNTTKDVATSKEGPLNAPDVSTRFLEKGDFIRLANLTLRYKIPMKGLNGLSVFATGQNLLTITSYTGQDPEVNTNKAINGVPSFGIDYTAYPRVRTWTFGANISF